MSKKREAVALERAALVRKVLTGRPRCEIPRCDRSSEHVHEILTRARGGSILDESNVLAVCHQHHRFIHDNPSWATERGLLIASWDGLAGRRDSQSHAQGSDDQQVPTPMEQR